MIVLSPLQTQVAPGITAPLAPAATSLPVLVLHLLVPLRVAVVPVQDSSITIVYKPTYSGGICTR